MGFKSAADVVIFAGNYPAWPGVTRSGNGKLYCVFREDGLADRKDTGHGYSPLGKVLISCSEDGGQTWSAAGVVADNEGYDDVGVGICALPDQTLLVSYYSRFSAGGYSQAWVTRSADGGLSWSPSVPTSEEDSRARAAPLALSNGEILVPIYRSMFSAQGHQSIAAVSGDGGCSWQNVFVPNAPGGELNEWAVLEVEPGRIIGLHRDECESTRGCFWKTESQDWGRTWSAPLRTNVRDARRSSSPPQLDFHGGRVVLTYADARMVSVSMVSTTDADFVRWDLHERVPCYQYRADGRAIADASYPCSVAVGKRRRLVVDYEIESLITPDADHVIDYELAAERKEITGYFVDTPAAWGFHDL